MAILVCESWKAKLDTYLDSEVPEEAMRTFELQNSEFTLLGGRMTYLEQTPGAHLIYDVRKHHISVFVFQERSLPARL
jgi:hypothetical protein